MSRKNLTLILMLVAGAATCIVTFIQRYSVRDKLFALLTVLVVFFFLGSLFQSVLDRFERENQERNNKEGEVIEKQSQEEEVEQA